MVVTRSQRLRTRRRLNPILQMAVQKIPVETAYKDYYNTEKVEMEFSDFDFWYYRFYNGDHDLDFDRELSPKYREMKDLPPGVFEKINRYLDIHTCLSLRQVTPFLRDAVDSAPIHVNYMSLELNDNKIAISYNHKVFKFKEKIGGCQLRIDYSQKKFVENGDYVKLAFKKLKWIFGFKKLKIEKLIVGFYGSNLEKMSDYCNLTTQAFSHQIHLKTLRTCSKNHVGLLRLLPFFEPKVLETIETDNPNCQNDGEIFEEIIELEQWKQLKHLKMKDYLITNAYYPLPIETLFHLTSFELGLPEMSVEDAVKIRDIFLPSQHAEKIELYIHQEMQGTEIPRLFGHDYCFSERYYVPKSDIRWGLKIKLFLFEAGKYRN